MKKLAKLVLGIAFIAMTTVSCNKDDDNASATLEGKWEYSKQGISASGVEQLTDYEHATGCAKDYLEFVSGGTLKDVYYQGSECTMNTDTGTWSKSGNSITIDFGDGAHSQTIVELTSTTLKVTDVFEGVSFVTVYKKI